MTAINRYWAESYIQRNPGLALISAVLRDALKNMPADMTYEIGTGNGNRKPHVRTDATMR